MAKLNHDKSGRTVDVAEEKVEYYVNKGWQAAVTVAEPEEVVIPDPDKANHEAIDAFAGEHEVTYDGIEAKDAEKPTKAEKVAHIQKVMSERESA